MVEMLQQLYASEVPEAVREYGDSKATPVARPKRPAKSVTPKVQISEAKLKDISQDEINANPALENQQNPGY